MARFQFDAVDAVKKTPQVHADQRFGSVAAGQVAPRVRQIR
jgi:hypothetical protein